MNSRLAATSAALMAVLFASGCASTDGTDNKQAAQPAELVYRTGSNIPVRDARPLTKEEKEKQAEDAQRMLSRPVGSGGVYKPGG